MKRRIFLAAAAAAPTVLRSSTDKRGRSYAEVEKLLELVRTALTDRQWDKVTAASNELADTLFYLEDA